MRRLLISCAMWFIAFGNVSMDAMAREPGYPDKSIRLVSPFPPGGGTDFVARTIASKLAESERWNVVVENRAGANGTIGLSEISRAESAGYDLVIGQRDNMIFTPLSRKVSFDPGTSFQAIAFVASTPLLLVTSPQSKFEKFSDLAAAARSSPGKISMASSGVGSSSHIASELLRIRAGIEFQHIPYKGSAQALADAMGGQVDVAGSSIAAAISLVQAGKLRPLAVLGGSRSPALPDVPSILELGIKNVEVESWFGVLAPAGISQEKVRTLNMALNRVIVRPDVVALLRSQGLEPQRKSVDEFSRFILSDHAATKTMFAEVGISLN